MVSFWLSYWHEVAARAFLAKTRGRLAVSAWLVGETEADPRYEFHLALAYSAAGKAAEARKALQQARANGLKLHTLAPSDQELLAKLDTLLADASASKSRL